MLSNHHYNLMETISIISKSLHRYDTYLQDAGDCEPCKDTWSKIRDEREKELSTLVQELKDHIENGDLDAQESDSDRPETALEGSRKNRRTELKKSKTQTSRKSTYRN